MAKVAKRRDRYILDYYDHEGCRKRRTMPKGTTKKAAQDELDAIRKSLHGGYYVPVTEIPTFEAMAGEWLELKETKIRSSTWAVYEGHTRNYFNEWLDPTNHNNMVNIFFIPALEVAGLKKIRFHDVHHRYASLLISQGENIKYIQVQMGHSNPTLTLNVYAHLMEDKNQGSARRLEGGIFSTSSRMVAKSKRVYREIL